MAEFQAVHSDFLLKTLLTSGIVIAHDQSYLIHLNRLGPALVGIKGDCRQSQAIVQAKYGLSITYNY